jgi:hypothetical protein
MTDADRELIVLAAKAAGIRFDAGSEKPHPKSGAWFGLWLTYDREPSEYDRRYWNPLTDDGDALRLAVQLRMDIFAHGDSVETFTMRNRIRASGTALLSPDPCAATRRAIVAAAAEIGKNHHG